MGALVADGGDHGLFRAKNGPRVVAELLDFSDDFIDLGTGSVGFDDDDHGRAGGKLKIVWDGAKDKSGARL